MSGPFTAGPEEKAPGYKTPSPESYSASAINRGRGLVPVESSSQQTHGVDVDDDADVAAVILARRLEVAGGVEHARCEAAQQGAVAGF